MSIVLVFVIAPPDDLSVWTVAVPDLGTVVPAAIAADDLAGKHTAAGVGAADFLAPRYLRLCRVEIIRVNDRRMGVLFLW